MNAVNIENLFEECMQRLAAGANLDEVLAEFPSQADELRPMLQAAKGLQQYASEIKVPQSAQMRSRAQFLTAAARIGPANQKRGFRFNIFHLRLAASTGVLLGIFGAVLLLSTGFASANSLPGDVFYPVKIMVEQMRVNLVQDLPARMELEEVYDDRRQQEVAQLTKLQRQEQVTFSGFLQNAGAGKWKVGSVVLVFAVDGPDPEDFEGSYVQIVGKSNRDLVEVESIKLHRMQWEGVLQAFDQQSWTIGGLSILVEDTTEISGPQPQIGAAVRVIAVRPSGDHYAALELTVLSLPPTAIKLLPKPSQTPSKESGESTESGEEKQPEKTPRVGSPTPSPEYQATRTRETEEENKTKSKPSPTPTRKSDKEYQATRTPTRESGSVPEATRTPTRESSVVPEATRTPDHDD